MIQSVVEAAILGVNRQMARNRNTACVCVSLCLRMIRLWSSMTGVAMRLRLSTPEQNRKHCRRHDMPTTPTTDTRS